MVNFPNNNFTICRVCHHNRNHLRALNCLFCTPRTTHVLFSIVYLMRLALYHVLVSCALHWFQVFTFVGRKSFKAHSKFVIKFTDCADVMYYNVMRVKD